MELFDVKPYEVAPLPAAAKPRRLPRIRSQTDNRRYYLHRKAKAFSRLMVRSKQVFISTLELSEKQKQYLNHLRGFGYTIQTEIS